MQSKRRKLVELSGIKSDGYSIEGRFLMPTDERGIERPAQYEACRLSIESALRRKGFDFQGAALVYSLDGRLFNLDNGQYEGLFLVSIY